MKNGRAWIAGDEDDGSFSEALMTATCARCHEPFRRTEERIIARSTPVATVVHARCAASNGLDAAFDGVPFASHDSIDTRAPAAWRRARQSIGEASARARNRGYDALDEIERLLRMLNPRRC